MKKFLALAMALCLSVTCLAGCTNDEDKDPDASQTPGSSVEQPVDDEQQPVASDEIVDDELPPAASDEVTDDEKDVNSSVSSGAAD